MNDKVIDVRPISGSLGAEIHGVDLSRPLGNQTFAEIHRAFHQHLVIFFRDQHLSPNELKAFSARFGALSRVPYVEPLDDHPDIIAVLKEADECSISVFGGEWHSDFSFLDEPPLGSALYAIEVPNHGGDTLWANMHEAYETLSDGMKTMLDGMSAVHVGTPYGTSGSPPDLKTSTSIKISRNIADADKETTHPVVRVHPQTGKKALFVNSIYTTRFADMTEAESAPLLATLYDHATRPEFTCRFRWEPRSLALWDNRSTMHYAINDYDGQRRLMHRTTIAGEKPTGTANTAAGTGVTRA